MSSPPLILPPGATLGGFDIEDVLGIGGMAVVYCAVQRSLGRRVALKVLIPRLAADATFRERFRREGALVATLDHPNVIPVYDSGEVDGRLYLAMRLVDGVTLSDRMLDHPLSPAETLDVLGAVASALDTAHAAGLLHRDIKPQNILLSHTGSVYLADFGVAKMAGAADLTRTGGFLGSVTYVSPEHIRGDAVGPPTDVYALATVAYECLSGQAPFRRDTEAGVIHAHLTDPPPPLEPTGDMVHAAVSRALAAGLEKDPAARLQSAGALVAGLADALAGAPAELMARRPGFARSAGGPAPAEAPAGSPVESPAAAGGAPSPTRADELPRPIPPGPPAPPTPPTPPGSSGSGSSDDQRPPASPPALEEHTLFDRRRDEFVRSEKTTTLADRLFRVLPLIALVAAVAIPLVVREATKDEPVGRLQVGAISVAPIPGWASTAFSSIPVASAFGLEIEGGRRWRSADRKSTILIGELASTSRLSPVGLGEGESVAMLKVPGGTLRRWSVGDPQRAGTPGTPGAAAAGVAATSASTPASTPLEPSATSPGSGAAAPFTAVAIAATAQGPLVVICVGAAATTLSACNRLTASAKAEQGALAADPDASIATALAGAVAESERVRARTLLPSKDRETRERRAKLLARAYRSSAAKLTPGAKARPWDGDLGRAQQSLLRTSTAYARIASAAAATDRARDRSARAALRDADRRLREALGRLGRRGYAARP